MINAAKHHFVSLNNDFISFLERTFSTNVFNNHDNKQYIFLNFDTHVKLSSSTASRELSQCATCSG